MITEHHEHMPKPEEFDFSVFDGIFSQFPSHCDVAEEDIYPDFLGLELLLSPDAVYAYLNWCLSKPEKFKNSHTSSIDIKSEVTPDFTNPNHVRFLKDAFIQDRLRLKGTLPLSESDYEISIRNLQAKPELFRAVVTLKEFLQDYLRCLQEKAHESDLYDENSSDFVQKSLRMAFKTLHNGIRTGFIVEFAALTGMGLSNENVKYPAILHQIFAAPNAFEVFSIDEDGEKNIHKCPFANTAAQMLTTEFSESADKQLAPNKLAGGILLAIVNKYKSLERGKAPSVKPV